MENILISNFSQIKQFTEVSGDLLLEKNYWLIYGKELSTRKYIASSFNICSSPS